MRKLTITSPPYPGVAVANSEPISHIHVVELPLKHGANPNISGNFFEHALYYAAEFGLVEIARLLIRHEANLEVKNPGGFTLVLEAARKGQLKVMELLLAYGAEPSPNDVPLRKTDMSLAKNIGTKRWWYY